MGSWEKVPTKTNPTPTDLTKASGNSLARRLDEEPQLGSTLATENLEFDVTLTDYTATTSIKYSISVKILECHVSETEISVPEYQTAQVIDLDKEG